MKLTARFLIVVMLLQVVAPAPAFAQQPSGGNISQLREQIAKLEKIDLDPETSQEAKALNREFLRARRAQLSALVQKRVAALRQYLAAAGDALEPRERQAVEESIQSLSAGLPESEAAAGGGQGSVVGDGGAAPANGWRGPRVDLGAEASYRESSIPAVITSQPGGFLPASEAVPSLYRQGEELRATAPAGSKTEELVIDTTADPRVLPTPLEVENKTVVTVRGTKSVIDRCVVNKIKSEEVKPEPNPLGQIIKVLFGLGPFALGKAGTICAKPVSELPKIPNADPTKPPVTDPDAERIEAEINALRASIDNGLDAIVEKRSDYEKMANRITQFSKCRGVVVINGLLVTDKITNAYIFEPICGSETTFEQAKLRLKDDVKTLIRLGQPVTSRELPAIESAEVQMAAVRKALIEGYKKKGGDVELRWIDSVNQRLDCLARHLEAVRRSREFLQTATTQFESFYELLDAHKTSATYQKVLDVETNQKVTYAVACTNFFTKQPSSDPINFTVIYQDQRRDAVTAGVLFTTLDKRQIGIQPVRTGTAADGTSTFRLTFAETDRAAGQVVPFTFYNYRLWGGRKFGLNGSGGLGVNPNNGSAQVEFFFGGSLGINNVFIQFGGHAGRWQELGGGFVIGDAVPSAPPSVPIERRYSVRPSVGVSYKLPLP